MFQPGELPEFRRGSKVALEKITWKGRQMGETNEGKSRPSIENGEAVGIDATALPYQKCSEKIYAIYVLCVLMLCYVLNFVDRQILSILAESIKADLEISDAQLGFLYGTAFSVFYASFGIVLGRLADAWTRTKLISIGIAFWSVMTAMSGMARSFAPLAVCRFGVAIGEASASPAAFSLLYDYFSPRVRTTVIAFYSGGLYIGMGVGLYLGGATLDLWHGLWPDVAKAPFGLKGWQAVFMIVGLPGLLMAAWVSTLREPVRGASDGVITAPNPHPFRDATSVFLSMVPFFNWPGLLYGANGRRAVVANAIVILVLIVIAWILILITGDYLQWIALGTGVYAMISWAQWLSESDSVAFGLIFRCRSLQNLMLAVGVNTFMNLGVSFWSAPLLQRQYGVSAGDVGSILGLAAASMGFCGILLGGWLSDRMRMHTRKGKLYIWIIAGSLSVLSTFLFLIANDLTEAYVGVFLLQLTSSMALSPVLSTVNDLVIPRVRATASAVTLTIGTLVGVALGPYFIGHLSDALIASGLTPGEALNKAMLWSLLFAVAGIGLVCMILPRFEIDEASVVSRARELGEKI